MHLRAFTIFRNMNCTIKPILLTVIFFLLNFSIINAQSWQKQLVDDINLAFKEKNFNKINHYIDSNFSIGAYSGEPSHNLLTQLVNYPVFDSIVYVSSKRIDTIFRITSIIYAQNQKKDTTALYVDVNQKIKYIDFFDKAYGLDRYQKSRLVAKIPFEIHNGSILLKIYINDHAKPLRMLFDTGADGMAVSKELAGTLGLNITEKQNTSIVGGSTPISVSKGNRIKMNDTFVGLYNIAVFEKFEHDCDGIFGNNIARKYIVEVDYEKQEISLYNFGDYQYSFAGNPIKVGVADGNVTIKGLLNMAPKQAVEGNFTFDTGASYSLICFSPFVKSNRLLVNGFKPLYQSSTISMGQATPTFSGEAKSFCIGSRSDCVLSLPITLMAGNVDGRIGKEASNGSIGSRLISRYNFVLNLQKQEILLTKNKSYNYPQDFVLGPYFLGYNNDGNLYVLAQVHDQAILPVGTQILAINGKDAKYLRTKHKTINELSKLPSAKLNFDSK